MENLNMDFCPCCNESFSGTELSKLVFCPDCGTPVHRHCWKENGGCPNADKHSDGFTWKSNAEKEQEKMIALQLEHEKNEAPSNTDNDKEMEELNREIEQIFMKIHEENNPDEQIYMGVSEREMKSFLKVGSRQSVYRFALLRSMAYTGKKMSINMFAGFLNPYYQFYKGMFPLGILLTVLQIVVAVPQMIYYYATLFRTDSFLEFIESDQFYTLISTASWIHFAITVLLCLFGDYLYLVFAVRKIKRLRTEFDGKPDGDYHEALRTAGASKPLRIVAAIALEFFLMGICLLIIQALS